MAIRREPTPGLTHVIPDGIFRAIIEPTGTPNDPVILHFLRSTDGKPIRGPRFCNHDNTVRIDISTACEAPNMEEGKVLARSMLKKLPSGEVTGEETPYDVPIKPELVDRIEHPALMLSALILKWPNEYEVRTIGLMKTGMGVPVASPLVSPDLGWEWCQLNFMERIYTDNMDEAIYTANHELCNVNYRYGPYAPRQGINDSIRKYRSTWCALHHDIAQILWRDWDPIGVNHYPNSLDEYDSYVNGLVEVLLKDGSKEDVLTYLWGVQTGPIGIRRPPIEHSEKAALACIEAYQRYVKWANENPE
jgi:hypothetical protein